MQILSSFRSFGIAVLFGAAFITSSVSGWAVVIAWDESTNGDGSNNQAVPSAVSLVEGANSVIGFVVGSNDSQDWYTLHVPFGFQLSAVTLASYTSTDDQGFTGVQSGTSFVGSPFLASSYLGYAHYGTAAVNGSLPPANLLGSDILPIMGNTTTAPGSQGFTPPLPSGDYTFLIQQLGAATGYQFDYVLTAVPEVNASTIVAVVCCAYGLNRRFRKK